MRISFGFSLVFPLQQHFECGETPAGTRERRAKRFMHRVSYMIPALVFITLVCSRVNEQHAFSLLPHQCTPLPSQTQGAFRFHPHRFLLPTGITVK